MSDISSGLCPFCQPEIGSVFYTDPSFCCLWSKFEVAPGHALIVPKRHVSSLLDFNREETAHWPTLIEKCCGEIEYRFPFPQGYNIGVNIGTAAGQTIMHAHIHVIPRYLGDVPDPRGGVRNILPKGNYLATETNTGNK